MLIELELIGEIRWYAYQKLTNDMNISSHIHRLYMFFFFLRKSKIIHQYVHTVTKNHAWSRASAKFVMFYQPAVDMY